MKLNHLVLRNGINNGIDLAPSLCQHLLTLNHLKLYNKTRLMTILNNTEQIKSGLNLNID